MKKVRILAFCLTLTGLLAACSERGSGFSPAENAVTAVPEDTIDLRARDYELPPATPAPDGPTASYDTGDSSGGRTLTLNTLNPALERAAETEGEVADAVAENALETGRSTTIADETSEGDAAEVTGGDVNVVTDTADTITDTVVDPATGGEAEVENSVEEVGADEVGAEEDAVESTVEAAAENVAEQTEDASDEGVADETVAETGGTEVSDADTSEIETGNAGAINAETGGATAAAGGSSNEGATPDVLVQAASSFDWEALGATVYANCAACHQQNGAGIPGAFPPLAGHIDELYNAPGGRKYLINVVIYGLQGELEALGQTYNGLMTPWGQLNNEEIAATLNHELTSWGNDALLEDFSPILPDEVEAERANELSAAQVLALRPELP